MTWLLLLLACGLGGTLIAMPHLGLVDTSPITVRQGAPAQASSSDASTVETPVSLELSEFTETIDRPLFFPDRRPPAKAPTVPVVEQTVEAPTTTPPALELSAVIIDGARRLALFRATGSGGGSQRAEEGSQVEGWTVTAVRADGVVLERNGAKHELALRTFKPPPAPARAKKPTRTRRAQEADKDAEPEVVPRARPRRPLRGPRRRSIQRRSSS